MSLAPGLFRCLYELHRLREFDCGQIAELVRLVGRKGLADAGSMGEPDRPRGGWRIVAGRGDGRRGGGMEGGGWGNFRSRRDGQRR